MAKEIRKRTKRLQHEDENWPPFNARFENASTCIAPLTEHEDSLGHFEVNVFDKRVFGTE